MLALERLSGALKLSCWPATTKGYRGGIQVPIPSRVDLVGLPGPHGRNACAGTVFERDATRYFFKKIGTAQNFDVATGWQLATRPNAGFIPEVWGSWDSATRKFRAAGILRPGTVSQPGFSTATQQYPLRAVPLFRVGLSPFARFSSARGPAFGPVSGSHKHPQNPPETRAPGSRSRSSRGGQERAA